jgi:hypothetical protein
MKGEETKGRYTQKVVQRLRESVTGCDDSIDIEKKHCIRQLKRMIKLVILVKG